MQSKHIDKPKVNIITLGCSKNLVDSEQLGRQLQANNIEVNYEKQKGASISIINTCGFIDRAKEQSVNTILEHIEYKKKGKINKLYVTGCLSERYKDDLIKEMPEVDAFFGTLELPQILKTLNADYKKELIGERLISTPSHYAYLKISEGCNRTCSFCAIPLMRGKHISKTIEQLIEEATYLAHKGVKEIMLIAQELTYYGLDIYKKRALPELLEKLSLIKGIEWIRLHYAYPHKFPLDVLDVMQGNDKICKYLDMPLQHSSDKMLKEMRRNITYAEMQQLLDDIRKKVPDITLRTTFLVGHPNETEQDIEHLKAFIEAQQFHRVGVFKYSHEEGTYAGTLKDNIAEEIKEQRAAEIMDIQREISIQHNQQQIGKTLKVLIDSKQADAYIGRTESDSPDVDNEVICVSAKALKIGSFVNVNITEAFDYDLKGNVI